MVAADLTFVKSVNAPLVTSGTKVNQCEYSIKGGITLKGEEGALC